MQILVSSKNFYSKLKALKEKDVLSVQLLNGVFGVSTGDLEILTMYVEGRTDGCLKQENVRWDFLLRTIGGIPEQPIVIEFGDNTAQFTLKF